jgi:pimeloyl-ACP methyl ester carboxylesterase
MKIENIQIASPACTLAYALWEPTAPQCKGTVVAVHGLTRQKRDFDFIAGYLAENGYKVLAVDAPGRGDSSRFENPDDYRFDVYADIFSSFLHKLSLDAVHWIGTSMGGLIALEMAQMGHGHLLQSLTLVDITHKPNLFACKRIAGYITEELPILQNVEQQVDFTKANLPLGEVPDEVWRHFAIYQLVQTEKGYTFHFDPKIVRQARIDLLEPADWTEGLKKLTCPIALVAGEISDLCTKDEITSLKSLKPAALIHICAKAGHIPALNDDSTKAFIGEFLKSAPPKTYPQ